MASKFFFGGQLYTSPVTVSSVDDSAMAPTSLTVGNVLAVIGQAFDGQPNTPLAFGDPTEAVPTFAGGDLAYGIAKAFNPSNDDGVNAPNQVIAIRVGTSTQASLILNDAAGNNVIELLSNSWGALANLAKASVAAGSVSGSALNTAKGNTYYSGDNIGQNAFTVEYGGGQASATMTIANASVILAAPLGTPVATIDLTVYQTIGQLVDRINSTPGFTAAVSQGSDASPALNGLDSVVAQDVKTALYTATADLQACVNWFNSNEALVTAVRMANAGAPPVAIGWTYLTGGSDPAVLSGDWANALSVLQGVDVQWIACLSGDPAVHAAVDAHCQYMSTVGRKERRACLGPVAGTSFTAAKALPIALNSDRSSICWPGYWDYNAAGVLTLYPSYFTGLLVAAAFSGSGPGTPMTNKSLTVRGLEFTLRNPTDTDPAINAGLLVLEATPKGFEVVRSISTWLNNDNYNRVEQSCGAATDYVVRTVRDALDILRGGRGDPGVLARAVEIAAAALKALAVPLPEGPGVIVGDANSPAFKNITATLSGDQAIVSFECSPVIPLNFIGVAVGIQPYSGSASVAAS